MRITLPYGRETVPLYLDKKQLIGVFSPVEVTGVPDASDELGRSMANPVGCEGLQSLISAGKKVAIAVDDNTRVTPVQSILTVLLEQMKSLGVKREDVVIVVALGTHRKMTEQEMKERYSPEVVEEYDIVNHDCNDPSGLRFLGKLPGNVPVYINKRFLGADIRIGVGNIVPHFTAGWSAGSKILLPGLAGQETVGGMHYHGANTIPNAVGKDVNPPRTLMDDFAEKVGLHFIINTVLTRSERIYSVHSGDFIQAHREGVGTSKQLYSVRIPRLGDVAIVSSYPADIEFWQAMKGLYSADLATRKGGGILLVTPCPEGISVTHKGWADLLAYDSKELEEMIKRKEVEDITAASLALCVAKTREPYTVCLCSEGISEKEAEKLHFQKFNDPQEALSYLDEKVGMNSKKVVLTHGGETFPIPESS